MLSEQCVRSVFGRGLSGLSLDCEMSTLSMRAPGIPTTTVLDVRALRVRETTTVDRVRRNLFGCSNSEENKRFLERELARDLEIKCQRWGFDFANEVPLPGTQIISWQAVPASTLPPVMRNMGISSSTIPRPGNDRLSWQLASPSTLPALRRPIAVPCASVSSQEQKSSSPESSKTQKRITDFLKPRKRLATSGKKSPGGHAHKHECGHGAHIRPPKVARLSQALFKRTS